MLTNDQIEYMEKTYQLIYCGLTPEVYQTTSFYKLAIQAKEANQLREELELYKEKAAKLEAYLEDIDNIALERGEYEE